MTNLDQRVAVLIDTQNMYHSAKHIHNARLAFAKIVDALTGGRPLIRVFAYVAKSKTGEEQAFFGALQEAGIELKVKDVQEFASGEKKADWDVGMTVDAIRLAPKVDTIILMTGDGDFVPLVHFLQQQGVRVEVAAFGESTNAQLKQAGDKFYDISTEGRTFLMTSKGSRTRHSDAYDEAFDAEPRQMAPKRGDDNDKPLPGKKVRVTF